MCEVGGRESNLASWRQIVSLHSAPLASAYASHHTHDGGSRQVKAKR